MGLYWWLHGQLARRWPGSRRRRAERWAAGIRVHVDDTGARWEVDSPQAEFAESGATMWTELAGVAESADNGTFPDGLLVLRRGGIEVDFLPLEAKGARALLDAARRRGLVRPLDELIAERRANECALSSDVTIRVAAPEEYDRARAAYAAWGYDGGVSPNDVVYVAERGTELTGVVRRTREHGVTMLRGMQVAPKWRRRRIGTRLLRAFVADLRSEECYCVPYTHLITFYGAAGFGVAREEGAPSFLRDRLADYRARGLDVLLMRRPARATMYGLE
ncbi:MAG: GNAT family N-acetyltransferase [Gemmatimonadaceae bacterium]